MGLAERICELLTPHMGFFTADATARHICAKFQIGDSPDEEQARQLRDFLRKGLVAYVGAATAESLAAECVEDAIRVRTPNG
jgi:aryl-alcohol dehydrogenase-like predicted oxidoreductase